jgi:micrococcal nuclease
MALPAEARVARRSSYFASGRDTAAAVLLLALVATTIAPNASGSQGAVRLVYRIDRVTDGDTVVLRNGQRVRLVRIDTPDVLFGTECYGPQASATTKRLLPPGTRVRLVVEPATDRVDDFGRLLRYVVRTDGVNINVRLVAVGAGAPWFYEGRRGMYANRLEMLAKRARATRLGLWRACPRTQYDPYEALETRR